MVDDHILSLSEPESAQWGFTLENLAALLPDYGYYEMPGNGDCFVCSIAGWLIATGELVCRGSVEEGGGEVRAQIASHISKRAQKKTLPSYLEDSIFFDIHQHQEATGITHSTESYIRHLGEKGVYCDSTAIQVAANLHNCNIVVLDMGFKWRGKESDPAAPARLQMKWKIAQCFEPNPKDSWIFSGAKDQHTLQSLDQLIRSNHRVVILHLRRTGRAGLGDHYNLLLPLSHTRSLMDSHACNLEDALRVEERDFRKNLIAEKANAEKEAERNVKAAKLKESATPRRKAERDPDTPPTTKRPKHPRGSERESG